MAQSPMWEPLNRMGVAWIARNDEPLEMRVSVVASFISVQLLADILGVSTRRVAAAVVRYRKSNGAA